MRGDSLPNEDHVLRYVRPGLVDDEEIVGEAFQKRIMGDAIETALSVNWLEFFAELTKDQQVNEVRRLFRLSVKRNGRFAELPVGPTIVAVLEELDEIAFKEDPLDPDKELGHEADPSHALIYGTPDPTTDSELAEMIGDIIANCVSDTHPAIV